MLNGAAYAAALDKRTEMVQKETHNALQTIVDELNAGQKKKIVKNAEVKRLLERYKVEY